MSLSRRIDALNPLGRTTRWLSRGASALALAAALGLLFWLGWAGTGTREEMRLAAQRAVRVAELRGTFAYLDEWLTMSAHMAAVSGDPRWVARYEEAAPKLDAAIAEAVALATPEVGAALLHTTDEANTDLVAMERAAFVRALLAIAKARRRCSTARNTPISSRCMPRGSRCLARTSKRWRRPAPRRSTSAPGGRRRCSH